MFQNINEFYHRSILSTAVLILYIKLCKILINRSLHLYITGRYKLKNILEIKNLNVSIEDTEILKNVNLKIPEGETHILLGPNGCGKSTLLMTIMGFPKYRVTKGKIFYKEQNITEMPMNKRAELGIGVSFQKPPAVKGVTLSKMLEVTAGGKEKIDLKCAETLNMKNYLHRDLNLGFSGGEIKRSELLQLAHQNPDLVLLDEPESGVDIENLKILGEVSKTLLEKDKKIHCRRKIGLIITHTGYILDYIEADKAHVMIDGQIKCDGNAHEIFNMIQKEGFKECVECQV